MAHKSAKQAHARAPRCTRCPAARALARARENLLERDASGREFRGWLDPLKREPVSRFVGHEAEVAALINARQDTTHVDAEVNNPAHRASNEAARGDRGERENTCGASP